LEVALSRKAALSAVSNGAATIPEPPRKLGPTGLALWTSIQQEYRIEDSGSVEMLCQACLACDRADTLQARINADGEMITTPSGTRANPLLKDELGCRAFVVRTLNTLGLNLEPARPPGRVPGTVVTTWRGN
jgi:hypothetical protein